MLDQLADADLAPDTLFADTGYGSGANLVASASRGVDLQAPVPDPDAPKKHDRMSEPVEASKLIEPEPEPEPACEGEGDASRADEVSSPSVAPPAPPKLSAADFTFEEGFTRVVRCPAGEAPTAQHLNGKRTQLWATFSSTSCEDCPLAARCPTKRRKDGRRTLHRSVAGAATQTRQREQQTPAFKERYKIRSGIESTNAELKSRHGAGELRVRGKARVNMAIHMKATALNVKRATAWHVTQGPPGRAGPGELDASLVITEPPDKPAPPPACTSTPPPRPREEAADPWWRVLGRRLLRRLGPAASPAWAAPAMGAAQA
ncbi:MAG: transposase [bacterium]|nr:transposase [bacterium]